MSARIVIIGAGIAGAATAYHLNRAGYNNITVLESEPHSAAGASGNDCGILYPRIELTRNLITEFYKYSFFALLEFLKQKDYALRSEFSHTGMLVMLEEQRLMKFQAAFDNHSLEDDYFQIIDDNLASSLCGIKVQSGGLWLPLGGHLSPKKLTKLMLTLSGATTQYNSQVVSLTPHNGDRWQIKCSKDETIIADIVILANAYAATQLIDNEYLRLEQSYGQVSIAPITALKSSIKSIICKDSYIAPAIEGYHHLGATFEKKPLQLGVSMERHYQNLEKSRSIGDLFKEEVDCEQWKGKAMFRCYSADRMPIVGKVPDFREWESNKVLRHCPNLYINTAHGSRGILSSFAAGKLITDLISNNKNPYASLLSASRFYAKTVMRK